MEQTCRRAVELGLPAVAFTEHVDHTSTVVREGELDRFPHLKKHEAEGLLVPPVFDADGYLASIERCRDLFPGLRIVSGVEFGELHRFPAQAAALLDGGRFDRILGSLHCLAVGEQFFDVGGLYYNGYPADRVIREYLAEIPNLVAGDDRFEVLAHIDYPVRYRPADAPPFDPFDFEEEFRYALRSLAGRTLEVNTKLRPMPEIVRWWREEGGETVSFGSDAHRPDDLANGFADAAAMVEAHGFRPGRHPYDVWRKG